MNLKHHREEAERHVKTVKFSIYVVSTSRYSAIQRGEKVEDVSGDLAVSIIKSAGFEVLSKEIIPDSREAIMRALDEALKSGADVLMFIGGTGITWDDVTIETLDLILQKRIEGFGEIFRFLSFQEVGPAAMISRATAGIYKHLIVFALPGSPSAVKLALEKLIIPEIRHIIYLSRRTSSHAP